MASPGLGAGISTAPAADEEARAPSATAGQLRHPTGDSRKARSHSPETGNMENCLRESREAEKPEASENTESSGKIEKYSVPLNKLKMMFEKGEAAQPKVRICPLPAEGKLKLCCLLGIRKSPWREWLELLTLQIIVFVVLVET